MNQAPEKAALVDDIFESGQEADASGAAVHPLPAGLPAIAARPLPASADPAAVRHWFDGMMDDDLPEADGTLETARRTAEALARRAKADNMCS